MCVGGGRLGRLAGGLRTFGVLMVAVAVAVVALGVLALVLNWWWLMSLPVLIVAVPVVIWALRSIVGWETVREMDMLGSDAMGPPSPKEQHHMREFDHRVKRALERRRKEDGS